MSDDSNAVDRPQDQAGSSDAGREIARAERRIARELADRLPEGTIDQSALARVLAEVVTVEISQLVSFQGPLPPPDMLAEYDRVVPGLAREITARSAREQEFRHEMVRQSAAQDRAVSESSARSILRGQTLGFIIAMTSIGGGIVLLFTGREVGGLVAIVSATTALLAAFISGRFFDWKKSASDASRRTSENSESDDD